MVIHYWLKRDFERLNKKSIPKPTYLKTFFEPDDLENLKNKNLFDIFYLFCLL